MGSLLGKVHMEQEQEQSILSGGGMFDGCWHMGSSGRCISWAGEEHASVCIGPGRVECSRVCGCVRHGMHSLAYACAHVYAQAPTCTAMQEAEAFKLEAADFEVMDEVAADVALTKAAWDRCGTAVRESSS